MMVVVEVDERRVERRHRRSGERSEKEKKREIREIIEKQDADSRAVNRVCRTRSNVEEARR